MCIQPFPFIYIFVTVSIFYDFNIGIYKWSVKASTIGVSEEDPAGLTEFFSLHRCNFMMSFIKYRMKALRKFKTLLSSIRKFEVTTIIFAAQFTLLSYPDNLLC